MKNIEVEIKAQIANPDELKQKIIASGALKTIDAYQKDILLDRCSNALRAAS